jgi:hypothetical protein
MASSSYQQFVASKLAHVPAAGFEPPVTDWPWLFDFQRDLTSWALRRGRAAIFANTGLGKTRMQLTWADDVCAETGGRVLILTPLAVSQQTIAEAEAIGVRTEGRIDVINYDRLHQINPADYAGVALDESSIIKHYDSKTLGTLLSAFGQTPYRLCCTATPAPNDWSELATHAEFLGVCTRGEMLAEFFRHDGGNVSAWHLKGHAREAFWSWVASWAALVRHPRDLGYETDGYDLPPLTVTDHIVPSPRPENTGTLFPGAVSLGGLAERRAARRETIEARVAEAARIVATKPDEPWIVWCDLNREGELLRAAIPGAVEVRGSDKAEDKERRLLAFARGDGVRVLISKPKIAGHGLNLQICANVVFVGVTDSWEAYYQAIRRCWRFGQSRPVTVHVVSSEIEGDVLANLRRKERAATALAEQLSAETKGAVSASIHAPSEDRHADTYQPQMNMEIPSWLTSQS